MAKRIVSGIFVLTALGALGVILAGALTSGEQLIVRFLTAVTVAALGLYVISDLRMQGDDAEMRRPSGRRSGRSGDVDPAPTSTAAYMQTVIGQHQATTATATDLSGRDPGLPSTFEIIEPVTQPAYAAEVSAGQPQHLNNSRLVPPMPEPTMRRQPPHPNVALLKSHQVQPAEEPDIDSLADTAPVPKLPQIDQTSVQGAPPITYSGPLKPEVGDWPPSSSSSPPQASLSADSRPSSDQRPAISDSDGPSDLDSGFDSEQGVDTMDVPVHEPATSPEHPIERERRPVSVDEVLSELNNDLSAPRARTVTGAGTTVADDPTWNPADVQVDETDHSGTSGGDTTKGDTTGSDTDKKVGERDSSDDRPHSRPHLTLVDSATALRQIEAAQYAGPGRGETIDLSGKANDSLPEPRPAVPAAADTSHSPDRLDTVIRSGELQVIKTLIQQGMLSTSGPITDRDVRTMVYVAFTSNELRKLIQSGGTPDGVRAGDVDLGPVELFDERRYAPLPKRIYDPGSNRSGAAAIGDPKNDRSRELTSQSANEPISEVNRKLTTESAGESSGSAVSHAASHSTGEPVIELSADDNEATINLDDPAPPLPPLPTPKHVYRKAGIDAGVES